MICGIVATMTRPSGDVKAVRQAVLAIIDRHLDLSQLVKEQYNGPAGAVNGYGTAISFECIEPHSN